MLLGSPGATARGSNACGSGKARTLLAGRRMRVYSFPGSEPPYTERIFACLVWKGGVSVSQLNRRRGGPHAPVCCAALGVAIDGETLAIHPPWVAYSEGFHGIDTSFLTVTAKDLRTGTTSYCLVGGARAPHPGPLVTKVVVGGNGHRAWIGETRETRLSGREVAACPSTELEVESEPIDSGGGIDLESPALHGPTPTWTDAGGA